MNGDQPNDVDCVVGWGVTSHAAGDRRRRPHRLLAADGFHRSGSAEAPSPSAGPDNSHLIERLAAGDPSALEIVYDAHAPQVYALALAVLGDEPAAERVVQETFFRLWSTPAPPETATMPLADRLLAMARELSLGLASSTRQEMDESGETPVESKASAGDRPPDDDRQIRIARAVRSLPSDQRLAIELAYFDGLSERAIADRLGVNVARARRLLRLGFAALRTSLAEQPESESSHQGGDPIASELTTEFDGSAPPP
jgi:RNA polymerase sigma-70 factor (ECF subfamily)